MTLGSIQSYASQLLVQMVTMKGKGGEGGDNEGKRRCSWFSLNLLSYKMHETMKIGMVEMLLRTLSSFELMKRSLLQRLPQVA